MDPWFPCEELELVRLVEEPSRGGRRVGRDSPSRVMALDPDGGCSCHAHLAGWAVLMEADIREVIEQGRYVGPESVMDPVGKPTFVMLGHEPWKASSIQLEVLAGQDDGLGQSVADL